MGLADGWRNVRWDVDGWRNVRGSWRGIDIIERIDTIEMIERSEGLLDKEWSTGKREELLDK